MLLAEMNGAGELDWPRVCVDGSHIRAKKWTDTGPPPVDQRKTGSKHHVLCGGCGPPLKVITTAANVNEGRRARPDGHPGSSANRPVPCPLVPGRPPICAVGPRTSVLMAIWLGQVEGTDLTPVTVHDVFGLPHGPLSARRAGRQALPGLGGGGAHAPCSPQRRPP